MREQIPCYAVIRFSGERSSKEDITIKEIVWSVEEAESEVDRLNSLALKRDSNDVYFWQYTRAKPLP